MRIRWIAFALWAATASLLPAAEVFAEAEGSSLKELSLDELVHEKITVTARKRTESLQDAPVSVSVLTAARLEQLNAENFSDYARTVPSLSFRDRGARGLDLSLRGVNAAYEGGIGQATVGVYIDEVPMTSVTQQPDLTLFDVDRIEVLRGPQGTLYGEGSMGGTLRIITRKPNYSSRETELESKLSSTEHGSGNYLLSALTNLPLIEDKLALRVGGYYTHDSGFIDSTASGEQNYNYEETFGARAGLGFKMGERFSALMQTIYEDKDDMGDASYKPSLGYLKNDVSQREPIKDRHVIYTSTLQGDLGWSQLTSATAYAQRTSKSFHDTYMPGLPDSLPGSHEQNNGETDTVVQELRLSRPKTDGSRLSWVSGLFYSSKENQFNSMEIANLNSGPFASGPPQLGVLFSVLGHSQERQRAVFGEFDYALTQRLTFTAGLRYFDYRLTSFAGQILVAPPGAPLPPADDDTRSTDSKLTKTAQLSFKVNDRLLLYTRAAEGFRVGGQNSLSSAFIPLPPTYDPDSTWNYELGVKTSWLDRKVELSGAVYRINWQDIQFRNIFEIPSLGLAATFIDNAGAARVNGLELEMNVYPRPGLSLQFGGSYMDARLSEDAPTAANPLFVNAGKKNDRIPFVPRVMGYVGMTYARSVPVKDLTLITNLNYQRYGQVQTQFNDGGGLNNNFYKLPAQNNVSLQLGIECAAWGAKIFVDNLLDERVQLDHTPVLSISGGGMGSNADLSTISTLRPRTLGLKLSKRFW